MGDTLLPSASSTGNPLDRTIGGIARARASQELAVNLKNGYVIPDKLLDNVVMPETTAFFHLKQPPRTYSGEKCGLGSGFITLCIIISTFK
jgi:hypothetical protein